MEGCYDPEDWHELRTPGAVRVPLKKVAGLGLSVTAKGPLLLAAAQTQRGPSGWSTGLCHCGSHLGHWLPTALPSSARVPGCL